MHYTPRFICTYYDQYTKICGIIAEYNPLHKGHVHHIQGSKELTGCEHVIAVMSGDFVQRGAPAICNKYERTRMALLAGVDVVIELPLLYALSSAERFARGAVGILDSLGCVESLCFGSECGELDALKKFADAPASSTHIKSDIRKGLSFAASFGKNLTSDELSKDTISSPNNILGIEYLRALSCLQSPIVPYTITRKGASYESEDIDSRLKYASARAIRNSLSEGKTDHVSFIPGYVNEILEKTPATDPDMFSDMLYYKLLSEKDKGFTTYLDVNDELSHKIIKNLNDYRSLTSFTMLLKSKNLTYTRISRCLFHILLDIKKEDATASLQYIRILGFRKERSEILSMMKASSVLPLITKLSDAPEYDMLKKDIQSSFIYERISKSDINEYRMSPIII